jgi:hypothetical protein
MIINSGKNHKHKRLESRPKEEQVGETSADKVENLG